MTHCDVKGGDCYNPSCFLNGKCIDFVTRKQYIEWKEGNLFAAIKENATLKAQRDELLEALKGSLEMLKQTASYRKSQGLTVGNVFLDSVIEQAEKAIEHCK